MAVALAGCPSGGGRSATSRATIRTASSSPTGKFRSVALAHEEPPNADELLEEALAGVVEDSGDASFGARMQVRRVRVPHPPRGASAQFNFGQGRRGWVTAMPRAELLTSPAFHDGRVFLGGGFASHRFYAFNAYSGELDWSIAAPDGGPTAAIVEDDKILFNTESCTIFVADADTGALLWSRWLGDPLMSQPAAADGLVFSAYPHEGGHLFGAFRLADGEPVWTTPIAADVIQAPQVVGRDVYFATMDGTAYRLDTRTGRVRWSRDVGASSAVWVDGSDVMLARRRPGAGTPQEQMIVLAAADGRLHHEGELHEATYLSGNSRDRELAAGTAGAWGSAASGSHLGLTNVAAGWAFQGSSPAVADGRAYFSIAGEVVARDVATTNTVWRREYAAADGAQALSPPAVVGSLLLVGTVDGQLIATDIDTGMTVWAYDLGEPLVFQPIVAQGWVYVATGRGNVIGLELGDAMLDGWHMWGGNAQHAGLVETAGQVDPRLLASLERPTQGILRTVARTLTDEERDETPVDAEAPEQRELPLRGTEVEGRVSGRVAEVFVTQRFENDGPEPIEAVYLFPLPADAAVDQMEMRIGDRVIRGVIRGRSEARQEYEAARTEGRRAALLEQQRPNLFAQRVANIAPGDAIEVRLRYVQTLPFEGGEYALTFPMVAPRRYDPEGVAPDALADATTTSATSAFVDEQPPVRLHLSVDAGLPIRSIASPSHEVELTRDGDTRAALSFTASGEDRTRDFVLRYAVGGDRPQAALLSHRTEEGGFFSLLIQPPTAPTDAEIVPRDVTFVVDTSSSMHGRPLEHARASIRSVIEGLRDTDRFNVIGFADQVRALSPAPVARDASSVERAGAFLEELRAVGATEMVPAIERALATPTEDGRLGIVVLVTDGYIGNEAAVLRSIATHLGSHRLYALGVGSAVNHFLVERAAEIGRGRAIVTALSDEPTEAAATFASYIDRPVFTDVRIDWGGLEVSEVYPRRVPDLFADRPLVVYGRFADGGATTVRVRGSVGGRRYERAIDVSLPTAPTPEGPHASQGTLWARAAVHERMNRLFLRDDEALIDEVRQIGLAHHLVTQWTSFVAVEQRIEPESEGEAEPEARATVSPARALPGDPEIRIPAPADARDVTILLPFGESVSAAWESELSQWTARFLIPRDAEEGTYPIEVLVTHADGQLEHLRLWYTVDATAASVHLEVEGDVVPGAEIVLTAEQVITAADLAQVGRTLGELSNERALLLSDARRVEARTPSGDVILFEPAGPGAWRATWTVPEDATGRLELDVVVVDIAANITHQALVVQVQR
ncbi:MAG: PQQ-binding-like beta-propeller repeat protein [Sandaracinaceae bacterium]|nr:PQQ-binding-like beta-propeller repeat protein [Sandaracinaceae bacterium]